MSKAFIGIYFLKRKDAEEWGKSRNRLIKDFDYMVLEIPPPKYGYIVISKKQAEYCGVR